jgi:hypothetical protein
MMHFDDTDYGETDVLKGLLAGGGRRVIGLVSDGAIPGGVPSTRLG